MKKTEEDKTIEWWDFGDGASRSVRSAFDGVDWAHEMEIDFHDSRTCMLPCCEKIREDEFRRFAREARSRARLQRPTRGSLIRWIPGTTE